MIKAVLFDVGGVLHTAVPDPAMMRKFYQDVLDILESNGTPLRVNAEELAAILPPRAKEYKKYSEDTESELPGVEILSRYYLKDFNLTKEQLEPVAEKICYLYDSARNRLVPRPGLLDTINKLHGMGMRMGIISNIISTTLVPEKLIEYGIAGYMETVVMSSTSGIRKPNAKIFLIATDAMQLKPAECIYVGDTISRDVIGSRNAGMGYMIRIRYDNTSHKDSGFSNTEWKADFNVDTFPEIVSVVESILKKQQGDA